MKKVVGFLAIMLLVSLALISCSESSTTANIKIVIDKGENGKYAEVLFDKDVTVSGNNPNIFTFLNKLEVDEEITVKFEQDNNGDSVVNAINDLENKTEGTAPMTIYQWFALINDTDVEGPWAKQVVSDGDTVIIKYTIWTFDDTKG